MGYIDCGGGLAVDYDGSFTDSAASMAYTLQHYANDGGRRADWEGGERRCWAAGRPQGPQCAAQLARSCQATPSSALLAAPAFFMCSA